MKLSHSIRDSIFHSVPAFSHVPLISTCFLSSFSSLYNFVNQILTSSTCAVHTCMYINECINARAYNYVHISILHYNTICQYWYFRASIFLVHLQPIKTLLDLTPLSRKLAAITPGFTGMFDIHTLVAAVHNLHMVMRNLEMQQYIDISPYHDTLSE